jgi:transcription antitermination protein NusB
MGTRRKAREAALQFLFQEDFCDKNPLDVAKLEQRLELFCSLYQVNRKAKEYTRELLEKTLRNRDHIDDLIRQSATNWRLERIAYTDRNILRIAVCEMVYVEEVAHQIAINEAVEIAKRFGSDESPPFVNGILDAVHKRLHQ